MDSHSFVKGSQTVKPNDTMSVNVVNQSQYSAPEWIRQCQESKLEPRFEVRGGAGSRIAVKGIESSLP
jgi:hypothetical protein